MPGPVFPPHTSCSICPPQHLSLGIGPSLHLLARGAVAVVAAAVRTVLPSTKVTNAQAAVGAGLQLGVSPRKGRAVCAVLAAQHRSLTAFEAWFPLTVMLSSVTNDKPSPFIKRRGLTLQLRKDRF